MKRHKVWMNGKLVDGSLAKVHVSDRGFLYGDGVFETMRAYAGVVFRLDAHIDRFFDSLEAMRIRPSFGKKCLRDGIGRLIMINGLKSAYIRLAVTRGQGRFGLTIAPGFKPNAIIIAKELEEYPQHLYERGASACFARTTRQNEYSPLSGLKSLNALNYILAKAEAADKGRDEAIMLNIAGNVAEGASSNIFLVKDGRLITPSLKSGILPGITRAVVIDIAGRSRIKVIEKTVKPDELSRADEAFFTNSLAEVLPVTVVDSKKIGDGKVGEMTRFLRISYQKEVIREVLAA